MTKNLAMRLLTSYRYDYSFESRQDNIFAKLMATRQLAEGSYINMRFGY